MTADPSAAAERESPARPRVLVATTPRETYCWAENAFVRRGSGSTWEPLDLSGWPHRRRPKGLAVASDEPGRPSLLAVDDDDALWAAGAGDTEEPSQWTPVAAPDDSPVTALAAWSRRPGHQVQVVATGARLHARFLRQSEGWSSWRGIGGPGQVRSVAGVSRTPSSQDVYALTDDGELKRLSWTKDHTWSTWVTEDVSPGERPTAVAAWALGPFQQGVVILLDSGEVLHRWVRAADGGGDFERWTGWERLPRTSERLTSLACVLGAHDTPSVLGVTRAGSVVESSSLPDRSWGAWEPAWVATGSPWVPAQKGSAPATPPPSTQPLALEPPPPAPAPAPAPALAPAAPAPLFDPVQAAAEAETATRFLTGRQILALRPGDPRTLGRFTLHGRLDGGHPATGKFLARDRSHGYAFLKLAPVDAAPEVLEAFRREVSTAKALGDTARLPRFFDAGEQDGWLYLATRFVPGQNLAHHLAALPGGRLPDEARSIEFALRLLEAIESAHDAQRLLLDVKPANIIMGDGLPVPVDFGASVDTQCVDRDAPRFGTTPYAAPELLRRDDVSEKSDLYSWAVVVAEAASGVHPLPGRSTPGATTQPFEPGEPDGPPDLEAVPAGLRAVVERVLVHDPAARPTAEEVRRQLHGLLRRLAPTDVVGRPAPPRYDEPRGPAFVRSVEDFMERVGSWTTWVHLATLGAVVVAALLVGMITGLVVGRP